MQNFFPAMTKIVGTLGANSRSVEVISGCLEAGMSGEFVFRLLVSNYLYVCVCLICCISTWKVQIFMSKY